MQSQSSALSSAKVTTSTRFELASSSHQSSLLNVTELVSELVTDKGGQMMGLGSDKKFNQDTYDKSSNFKKPLTFKLFLKSNCHKKYNAQGL